MRNLTPGQAERLRALTIDLILEARAAHLAGPTANPLKHWDQIHDRIKSASLRSDSVPKWATELLRELGIAAPSSHLSSAILALADEVTTSDTFHGWRHLVRTEIAYLMARARAVADQRREEREAKRAEATT